MLSLSPSTTLSGLVTGGKAHISRAADIEALSPPHARFPQSSYQWRELLQSLQSVLRRMVISVVWRRLRRGWVRGVDPCAPRRRLATARADLKATPEANLQGGTRSLKSYSWLAQSQYTVTGRDNHEFTTSVYRYSLSCTLHVAETLNNQKTTTEPVWFNI